MKKLLALLAMCLMFVPIVLGATVITAPADSAVLTLGSTYQLTGTTDLTNPVNCTWEYRHKGTTDFTTLSSLTSNITDVNVTIPDSFGTNQFNLTCVNSTETQSDMTTMSVSIKRYDAGEVSEVSVDLIIAVGVVFVSFASLIGLLILFGWMKKRVPRL